MRRSLVAKKLTKDQAQSWLDQNHPRYKILEWGESSCSWSIFLDTERGVTFKKRYSRLREKLKKDPNIIFNPSKEETQQKFKNTCLQRWGVENPSQLEEIKSKKEETCLKNHGVKYGILAPEIKEKTEQTNLQKYGHINAGASSQAKQKREKTIKEKWGVENIFSLQEFQEKAFESKVKKGSIKLFDGKLAKEWAQDPQNASRTTIYKAKKIGIEPWETEPYRSNLEMKIKKFLKEELRYNEINFGDAAQNSTDFLHGKKLPEHKGRRSAYHNPDFLFPKLKLIIEADGEHWHQDKEKDKKRNEEYIKNGYDLLIFTGKQIDKHFEGVKSIVMQAILRYELIP